MHSVLLFSNVMTLRLPVGKGIDDQLIAAADEAAVLSRTGGLALHGLAF